MPSSRASRRAGKMASTSTRQGYLVAGEAEANAQRKAKSGKKSSTSTTKKSRSGKNARKKAARNTAGATKTAGAKTKRAVTSTTRKATVATASDWRAAFALLMKRVGPETRTAIEHAAGELAGQMKTQARKNAFETMRTSAGKRPSP